MNAQTLYRATPGTSLRYAGKTWWLENSALGVRVRVSFNLAILVIRIMESAGNVQTTHLTQTAHSALSGFIQRLVDLRLLTSKEHLMERSVPVYWADHDVTFHASSRFGLNQAPLGATLRFHGSEGSSSTTTPPQHLTSGHHIHTEAPLRVSGYAGGALSKTVLERLLHLTFATYHSSKPYATAHKVYPSGGAFYSISPYLYVFDCVDLKPGFYSYDGRDGLLLTSSAVDDRSLLRVQTLATAAMNHRVSPRVVVVLASHVEPVFRKYEGIGYRLLLLEAGCILQALCVASVEVGLSVCALGTGDSQTFENLSQLPRWEDAPLVEIAINGSC